MREEKTQTGEKLTKNEKIRLISFQKLFRYGKILLICLLVLIEVILVISNRKTDVFGLRALWVIVPISVALAVENAVKLWGLNQFGHKIVCYVLDILLLLVLTCYTDGALISLLYIIILSEFYVGQEKLTGNIVMCAASIVSFLLMFAVSSILKNTYVSLWGVFYSAFADLLIMVIHSVTMNVSLLVYRKNRELSNLLSELNIANEKLSRANEELKTVAVLEERQRIAKDIHDTAGHSITTVIAQTEAAKIAVENNPEDAKRKIIAANLQAKHALEELRESVHLLSGLGVKDSIKDALLRIVHESMDGTDIVIRSNIEELSLCEAKSRFLCNTLKEGISNGLRHGGATAFYVELKREENLVAFLLSDNGCGVKSHSFREGFGLDGMRKRVESLGGTLAFESEEGEGFEIHVNLPSDSEENEQ